MADRVTIEAQPRDVVGKQVRQLRQAGWVPGVVYGQSDPLHVQMEKLSLRRALREAGTTQLIDLQIDGSPRTVLTRAIQMHPYRGEVLHVDFYEVNMQETITSEAELVLTGTAAPAAAGLGSVTQTLFEVEIECLPGNLVSEILVDVSQIRTPDDLIHVRDLPVPAGVEILTLPDLVVAKFEYAGVEEAEEEAVVAASADTVEVISKGKKEELNF
ncbi:MAG: 50S ribosomal protein L25 [Chloroflexota bacterium]